MATFTINIEALTPSYGSVIGQSSSPSGAFCTVGSNTNFNIGVKFNTLQGSGPLFKLGTFYTGAPFQTLRILNFYEVQAEFDPATPTILSLTSLEPGTESKLLNNGSEVTSFPLDIDLTSRVDINNNVTDLLVNVLKRSNCPTVSGLSTQRERIIEYRIIDENGIEGDISEVKWRYVRPTNII